MKNMEKEGMKWWIVKREEFAGWDCTGHEQTYLVAASNIEEAQDLFGKEERILGVVEMPPLPDLKRKKKPFIFL